MREIRSVKENKREKIQITTWINQKGEHREMNTNVK